MENKKEIVFLAHDPGGYDAIFPVFERISLLPEYNTSLLLTGASGDLNVKYKESDDSALNKIKSRIKNYVKFVLVVGSSKPPAVELDAVIVCKKHGIKTICILDYWLNYSERFTKNGITTYPDYYFLPDTMAYDEAVRCGVPAEICKVLGQPGLDKYINKPVDLSHRKDEICFLSQPLSALYGMEIGYNEMTVIPDIIKASCQLNKKISIKFHPRETVAVKKKYGEYAENSSLESVVENYKYIIGMNTMAMLHCYLMGASVISYEPNLKGDDFCVLNKLKITNRVNNITELTSLLDNKDSLASNGMLYNFIWMDGKSTQRNTSKIIELLNESDKNGK